MLPVLSPEVGVEFVWVWLMLIRFWIFGAFQIVVFLISNVQRLYANKMLKSLAFVCVETGSHSPVA